MFAKLKSLGAKSDKSKDSSNKGRNSNLNPQSVEQGGLLEDFGPREVYPPKPQFHELYRLGDVLGTGAFSVVKICNRLGSSDTFAVKCVDRRKLSDEDTVALLDEVAILRGLRHQHVIRLYDFIEEPGNYYLVMEQMCGGELFDRVVAKTYYNEKEARDTCKILLEAMRYCHANNVAHRDLKPENLLLPRLDNDSDVKIADFGFAKWCFKPKSLRTQCGTPGYVAPEILRGELYDTKVDMWSIGVILFILLGGMFIYVSYTLQQIYIYMYILYFIYYSSKCLNFLSLLYFDAFLRLPSFLRKQPI
jgi:calcium/calmodulin-dependent protein kinase I